MVDTVREGRRRPGRHPSRAVTITIVLASLALVACGGTDIAGGLDGSIADAGIAVDGGPRDAGPPRAIFEVPREGQEHGFFDLPWPSDLRRTEEGTVDARGFPNPRRSALITSYVRAVTARLRGFGTNGAVYFRFSRALDPTSVPSGPEATLEAGATAFVVDLESGERHPMLVVVQNEATLFWPGETLAMRPVHGIPLRGGHRYAAVVTRGVRARDGETLARDDDLEAILAGTDDPALAEARALYTPALDRLGVAVDDVLSLAVFTTHDPVAELVPFRDWMHAEYPAPSPRDATWAATDRASYVDVTGTYGPVPIFQEGELPYASEGGRMELGAEGEPVVHGEYDARFALSVPLSAMPERGYPLVLYSHGTGGDYRSFMRDGTAQRLAQAGIAVMGIDQIHHGARNPSETAPEVLFFNIANPDAARDNNRQSALDIVQQARVVASLVVPAGATSRGTEIRFDPERVLFFGHSQGGLVGPVYLAIDDGVSAAVISAGSAVISYALLEKTEPLSIPNLVRSFLGLPGEDTADAFEREAFGFEHPVITLVQSWIDASDGSNFGHLIFDAPREGFAPKSVLSTEGLMDEYAPPGSIEALATSMRVPQVEPVALRIESHTLLGLDVLSGDVSANVADGRATAGLLQYPRQGHFAVFEDTSAQTRIRAFLSSAAAGEIPVIPAP